MDCSGSSLSLRVHRFCLGFAQSSSPPQRHMAPRDGVVTPSPRAFSARHAAPTLVQSQRQPRRRDGGDDYNNLTAQLGVDEWSEIVAHLRPRDRGAAAASCRHTRTLDRAAWAATSSSCSSTSCSPTPCLPTLHYKLPDDAEVDWSDLWALANAPILITDAGATVDDVLLVAGLGSAAGRDASSSSPCLQEGATTTLASGAAVCTAALFAPSSPTFTATTPSESLMRLCVCASARVVCRVLASGTPEHVCGVDVLRLATDAAAARFSEVTGSFHAFAAFMRAHSTACAKTTAARSVACRRRELRQFLAPLLAVAALSRNPAVIGSRGAYGGRVGSVRRSRVSALDRVLAVLGTEQMADLALQALPWRWVRREMHASTECRAVPA